MAGFPVILSFRALKYMSILAEFCHGIIQAQQFFIGLIRV